MNNYDKQQIWDKYFIDIAGVVLGKSKDPRTKTGAVIVGPAQQIVATGYNGFPRGVIENEERWERPTKYQYVVHAEQNAIANAARHGIALEGCTLYVIGNPPIAPCSSCAKSVIQAGIVRVVGNVLADSPEHWQEDNDIALKLFAEADVIFNPWVLTD